MNKKRLLQQQYSQCQFERAQGPWVGYSIIILLFLSIMSDGVNGQNWNIKQLSVVSNTVSATTSLGFQFSSPQAFANGDCIQVTFPTPYTTPDDPYTAFAVNPVCSFTSSHSATCTKLTPLSFQIKFTSTPATSYIQGSATNFINPYSQRNLVNIDVSLYTNCLITAKTVQGTVSLSNFGLGSIQTSNVIIDSTPKVVGQTTAVLSVKFKPATTMIANGLLSIQLPVYYFVSGVASTDTMLDQASVITSPQMTINSQTLDIDPSQRTLTIDYTLISGVAATSATQITLSITKFKNPISTALKTGFQITTKDQKGYLIDQSFSTLPMASPMTTVATMDSPSFTFQTNVYSTPTSTFSVAAPAILTMNIQMPVPASDNCWIKVTFPVETRVDSALNTYYGTGFLTDPTFSSTIQPGYIQKSSAGNYVVINGCQVSSQIGSNPGGTLSFQYINMPAQVKSTGIFTISVFADSLLSVGICQATTFYIDASQLNPGAIQLIAFVPITTWVVQSLTSYQVSFTPQHKLYYNSKIVINVPVTVVLGTTCSITSSSGLGSNPVCSVSGSTFIITNPFNNGGVADQSDYTGGNPISINIASGTNPISAKEAGQWQVTTSNCILTSGVCANFIVDQGTATTSFVPVSGQLIANPGVTASTYYTYTSATYIFSFDVAHNVPSGGIIYITIPSEISIFSTSLASSSGRYLNTNTVATATATGDSIKLVMPTSHTVTMNPLRVSFDGVRNPRTYQTTGTFTVASQDSGGFTIDQGTGFTITMNQMGSINSFSASMSNRTNGAQTTYSINFGTSIPFYNGDILYLTFPQQILLTSNNVMYCGTENNINSLQCSSSGQDMQVKLTSLGASTGNFAFTVSNIFNPYSTRPSSTFTSIYFKDSSGYNIAKYSGSATVQTTTPANILIYYMNQASLIQNEATSYFISFTPTNPIEPTGSILLGWPSQITISSKTTCFVTTTSKFANSCSINIQSRTITIKGVFAAASPYYSNNVIIELTQVTNPSDNKVNYGFTLSTYADTDQHYRVDVLDDFILVPQLQCNYPCNTCSSDKSYCLSCYTQGQFSYLQATGSTSQTCLQRCNNGFTTNGDTNKQCVACDISCQTCVDNGKTGDKFKCQTCSNSYQYKYAAAQKCMTQCGLGYYEQNSLQCDTCKLPCQGCQKAATNCTSCFSGSSLPNLFANGCTDTCPAGYTSIGFQCQQCQSPCSTCVNSTSLCSTCDPASGKKYNFGFQCYSACPDGTNPNELTRKCEGCLAGCKSCDSNNQTNCLECQAPLLNYKGSCMSSCPAGYKQNAAKTHCSDQAISDLTLVYFPHLIAAVIAAGVCIGGYFKDRRSLIVSNILVFWGAIEFIAIVVQTALSVAYGNFLYMVLAFIGLASYVAVNIAFTLYFMKKIKNRDENFRYWWQYHAHTFQAVTTISTVLSFKVNRLQFSFFYGHDSFKASFSEPYRLAKLLTICSILNLICTGIPILIEDALGILSMKWGTQLYITLIETAILTIGIFVLTMIELCRLNKLLLDGNPSYKQVNSDSQMMTPMEDPQDKKNRKKALKAIMAQVKGNRDLFLNNKLDGLLQDFGGRKCKSMIAFDNEKEEDERKIKSFPLSPKSRKQYDGPFSFDENDRYNKHEDNVYADSKPPEPLANAGKTYSDMTTQLQASDLSEAIQRKDLDLINLETDDGMNSSRRDKKLRRRGRKNKYYKQIDEEDDEEADALEDDIEEDEELDTIKEEDEEAAKKSKAKAKMLQEQLEAEEEQKRQMKLQEEDQLKKQEEELLLKQEEEEKRFKALQDEERMIEKQKQEKLEKEKAEKQRLQDQENIKREKELLIQQEKIEKEKQEKEQAQQRHQEELLRQQEAEQQKLLEHEKELEEERLRKQQEEEDNKLKEDMEVSQLEEEIVSNKQEDNFDEEVVQGDEKVLKQENRVVGAQELHEDKRPPSAALISNQDVTSQNNQDTINNDIVMMEQPLKDFQGSSQDNDIQVPPDASKRNFNENDIMGDFDRDEKGNVIVLQDEDGNYVDKQGRKVNERGYLVDESGNGDIINNAGNNEKMFDNKDMDERGEVPSPFCVEKYNFNPHNIRGDFDYDQQGRPVIRKNKKGEFVDKKGQKVNQKGFLVDQTAGNIIDNNGRKKFDKKQLTPEGDLPKLFNYNGRRYDITDVIGYFDRDQNGNIIFNKNKKGDTVDNLGRKVNEKGYLLDNDSNVIDKSGKKIFDKKHLKNGEIPKIFPFTKFNIKNVLGTFEMDPLGNPILDKDAQGQLIDKDGRHVNQRGYLIDKEGNVIDKNGKVMFDKEILDKEGEIPKVFRTGLLKSDTASSLSRLMSEIEKNQPSEFDDDMLVQNEMRRLGAQTQQKNSHRKQQNRAGGAQTTQRRDSGGNTSVDSMMEDTPSNYNIANQRFEPLRKVKKIVEEQGSNYGGDNGALAKKRRKKKKLVAEVFVEPSDKDMLMARAYGGQAKATVKKKIMVHQQNARNVKTPASIQIRDQAKDKLQKLTNSISGYQNDPQGSSRNRGGIPTEHFRPPVSLTQSNFMDLNSNDASMMAVPDHHIREQRLKQSKMNELRQKNKQKPKARKQAPGGGTDPDFEKMFGKDIDEFLEDSDWDIESMANGSQYSRGSSRSAFGQGGRLRGLESIYLQRLETSMKKGGGGAAARHKASKPKAKFRVMHDRFIDDPELLLDGVGEKNSGTSPSGKHVGSKAYLEGAMKTEMGRDRSGANLFSGNRKYYDSNGRSLTNFDKSYIP